MTLLLLLRPHRYGAPVVAAKGYAIATSSRAKGATATSGRANGAEASAS